MLSKIAPGLFRGIGLAGIFLATFGFASGDVMPTLAQPAAEECTACHNLIGDHWINSAHGQASTNEAFNKAWDEQGNLPVCMTCHSTGYDADTQTWETPGVSCQTCHTPYNNNHPEEVMATDMSSRLCGNCHLETITQWQESVHGSENLTCNQCHNPHTTGLKTENSQDLCLACHRDKVHSFELTVHAANGLLCTDCHLRVSDVELGEGHGKRVHTFDVDLETCTGCHGEGLHIGPLNLTGSQNTRGLLVDPNLAQPALLAEPEEVSPVGYTILGTLLGVGTGMVIAPWLEKWFRRFRNQSQGN